jgi:putative transposase
MPRRPRLYLPEIPCHIIQRGNNKANCFFATEDYRYYKHCLREALVRHNVALHAYVLMTNHVHLLMTPTSVDGISRVMQHVGRLFVRYINRKYKRSGTLWEGRHKSLLVDQDTYLLALYRYIEMNPRRAGMVKAARDYPWSSCLMNIGLQKDPLVTPHRVFLALGSSITERSRAYQRILDEQQDVAETEVIRSATNACTALGSRAFIASLATGPNKMQNTAGRPRKQ